MSNLTGVITTDTSMVNATIQSGPTVAITTSKPTIKASVQSVSTVIASVTPNMAINANIQNGPIIVAQVTSSGPPGKDGLSAYELWLSQGNVGSLDVFLSSIASTGFVYEQIMATDIWTVNHQLNKFPSVTVVDSGGNVAIGEVAYISNNQITIRFSAEFSGKVYLN